MPRPHLRAFALSGLLTSLCVTSAANALDTVSRDPNGELTAREHLRAARSLYAEGEYEQALQALARAWIERPAPELLVHMAAAQARLNAPDKAAALLARYIIASKGSLSAERTTAILEAMDTLRARGQAQKVERLLARAHNLKETGQLEEALKIYDEALKLADRPEIWLERADTALLAKKTALALESYLRYRAGMRQADRPFRDDIQETVQRLYPQVGRIEVECPIKGATIVVDGTKRGTTPLVEPIFVEPKLHSVVIEKEGRTLLRTSVQSIAGRPASIFVPTDARAIN